MNLDVPSQESNKILHEGFPLSYQLLYYVMFALDQELILFVSSIMKLINTCSIHPILLSL
jgi:hypothetical protein